MKLLPHQLRKQPKLGSLKNKTFLAVAVASLYAENSADSLR